MTDTDLAAPMMRARLPRMGHHIVARLNLGLVAGLSLFLASAPVQAQQILRDAETEALFADMSAPLVRAAGLSPSNVKIYLINDRSMNAFVAGGQTIYVHSGLIENADDANQVQGVIAHELGHIAGGHVPLADQGMKPSIAIMVLSVIVGVAAAASGSGDAAMGALMAGQQAALGKYLAFSRVQEATADAAGAKYLSAAGISGRGSVEFFKKLQNLEFRYNIPQDDDEAYGRTHPLSGDRITTLTDTYTHDAAWTKPSDPALEARFARVKAKLYGFVAEPQQTLRKFPLSDQSIAGHYARAYAYHKTSQIDKALAETTALLTVAPHDPYFLELRGQVLLESGRPTEALPPLREANALTNAQPLIAALFGHALIATEDRSHFDEAERVLRAAISRDNQNPFAWYQLGVIYASKGDNARAALASAEQQLLENRFPAALANAEMAQNGLAQNTPDWLRAQDIAFVARAALEKDKRRGKRRP